MLRRDLFRAGAIELAGIECLDPVAQLIAAIRAQNAKISGFSDDIRGRMLSVAIDPEITELAARIQRACVGEQASTNEAAKTAIANLTSVVEELEIDTKPLLARAEQKASAYEAFQARRADLRSLKLAKRSTTPCSSR